MSKRVYLCGPINGCTYEECAMGWRKQVHDELSRPSGSYQGVGDVHLWQPNEAIEVFSPMRGKEFLKGWDGILTGQSYDENPISTKQAILGRDRYDTFNADLLFCNLIGAQIVSIGSMVEIGWADAKRIPIIICMEKEGNIHDHSFVKGLATYWVHSVDDGIRLAKLLLTPGI
jgi:hypothetical protein